ncbi:MAG: cysteine--tRNA ligase, partial [Nanoarchaeota archaeon]
MLKLYNTLTRKKELFKPLNKKAVGLYTCGITSYYYAHIGNFRTYIFEDFLKRVLLYNDYTVKHVMNITDVGHLTSDADTGEDKVELEARKEGKSGGEIAAFYTKAFQDDMKQLNILDPDIWCKATQHIKEQIELVKILERKGFTYIIADDGVYFDTSKLKDYGKLAKLNIQGLKAGARIKTRGKRNKTDFALWKFSPQGKQRQMEWKSPWSVGFPGWHLECSAMAMKYLGKTFDIHCG